MSDEMNIPANPAGDEEMTKMVEMGQALVDAARTKDDGSQITDEEITERIQQALDIDEDTAFQTGVESGAEYDPETAKAPKQPMTRKQFVMLTLMLKQMDETMARIVQWCNTIDVAALPEDEATLKRREAQAKALEAPLPTPTTPKEAEAVAKEETRRMRERLRGTVAMDPDVQSIVEAEIARKAIADERERQEAKGVAGRVAPYEVQIVDADVDPAGAKMLTIKDARHAETAVMPLPEGLSFEELLEGLRAGDKFLLDLDADDLRSLEGLWVPIEGTENRPNTDF